MGVKAWIFRIQCVSWKYKKEKQCKIKVRNRVRGIDSKILQLGFFHTTITFGWVFVHIKTNYSYSQKSLSIQYSLWKFQIGNPVIDGSNILSVVLRTMVIDIRYGKLLFPFRYFDDFYRCHVEYPKIVDYSDYCKSLITISRQFYWVFYREIEYEKKSWI